MGQITLNYADARRVLDNEEAAPDARIISACTLAFFEAKSHSDEIESSTRSIALMLLHMVAAEIYGTSASASADEEE